MRDVQIRRGDVVWQLHRLADTLFISRWRLKEKWDSMITLLRCAYIVKCKDNSYLTAWNTTYCDFIGLTVKFRQGLTLTLMLSSNNSLFIGKRFIGKLILNQQSTNIINQLIKWLISRWQSWCRAGEFNATFSNKRDFFPIRPRTEYLTYTHQK